MRLEEDLLSGESRGRLTHDELRGPAYHGAAASPQPAGALQPRESLDEPLQAHGRLEPRQRSPQAVVDAGGEGEVLRPARTAEVEACLLYTSPSPRD